MVEPMANQSRVGDLLLLTTEIVVSHVLNNKLVSAELPKLINQVFASLAGLSSKSSSPSERPQPIVPIKRSITADYIICLEDGKKLKMLKRHLKTAYGMTPDEYRDRWGLPADYPMVAPNYAAQRSTLAKKIGLGTKSRRRSRRN